MRFPVVASIVLSLSLLACSKSETPEPAHLSPQNGESQSANSSPTSRPMAVAPPAQPEQAAPPVDDPRYKPTACDRNEPGWKWVGNLVEEGKCVVGPCDCVPE